jgi:hypothetical protein
MKFQKNRKYFPKISLIILFLVLFNLINTSLIAQEAEYNLILKTGGLSKKRKLAIELSTYKTKSISFIKLLLNDENYWNRIAGIDAASHFADSEIEDKIFELYTKDHMTTSESKNFIQNRFLELETKYVDLYNHEEEIRRKEDLTKLIIFPIPEKTHKILMAELDSKNGKNRELALNVLIKNFDSKQRTNPDDTYIRSYIMDPVLRLSVIEYIQTKGNKDDLPIFIEILNSENDSFKEKSIALRAIRDWAMISEQKIIYEKILTDKSSNDPLKYVAIQVLPNLRSETIRQNLCNIAQTNPNQEMRLSSALALIPYDITENIVCLEKISNETIETKRQSNLKDAVAVVLTFGISGFINARNETIRRQHFTLNQTKIREHLNYLKKAKAE